MEVEADLDFAKAVAELETLVASLERDGDERALHALALVDAIHRPAIELLAGGELDHPIARAVLEMYGAVELDDELVVEEALDEVRPYVESHGGAVELLEVADGVVHVRMSGACHGCAASAMTLRRGIEEALRRGYPGFREVVPHEPDGAPGGQGPLLQIEVPATAKRPEFVEVRGPEPGPGGLAAHEVEGVEVVLANVEGEVYAFRNRCPVDGRRLDGGRLAGAVLVCPWHNCAYDARTGRRADDQEGDGLAAVPVAVVGERVRVAVNVA